MRLTKKQKYFLDQTPIGIWLTPNPKKYIKNLGKNWRRTVDSLRRRGYIISARKIGAQFEDWMWEIKRIK